MTLVHVDRIRAARHTTALAMLARANARATPTTRAHRASNVSSRKTRAAHVARAEETSTSGTFHRAREARRDREGGANARVDDAGRARERWCARRRVERGG